MRESSTSVRYPWVTTKCPSYHGKLRAIPFIFVVRKGDETLELRDAYLNLLVTREPNLQKRKELLLERVRLQPSLASAWLDLAILSRDHGTLEETNQYYERAIEAMRRNVKKSSDPSSSQRVEAHIQKIRGLQKALPEYFKHRPNWYITTEESGGFSGFVIKEKATNRVVLRPPAE